MSTNQMRTGRHLRFALAFVTLGGWVATAAAIDPDHRGIFVAGERPSALVKAEPGPGHPGAKKFRITARKMPWSQTLDWLGNVTGMSVVTTVEPEGSFSVFGPSRDYTLPELVDLLNNQLKGNKHPCLLVRSKLGFQLIPYEFNKPVDTILPRVTVNDLDQHGNTELAILDLPLDALPAEEIAKELNQGAVNNKMIGPLGKAFAVPNSNLLVVRDTVQNLKNLSQILLQAEEAEKKNGRVYKHKCIYVKAEDAERILKDLLGVAPHVQPAPGQPGQPPQAVNAAALANTQKNAVHVSFDRTSNTVFVSGPPAKIEVAKKTMEELDDANKGHPAVKAGPPTVQTYKIPGGNAPDVAKALKELYGSRSVTVSPVGKDSIMVLAIPEDQDAIRSYIQGARDQSKFEAIPLATLEAKKVYDNLTNLFDVKNGPAPTLDFDASRNMILVRGTTEQVDAVKNVLKQLGEDVTGQGSVDHIVINVEKGSAQALVQALVLMIPQRRKNPVRVVSTHRPGLGVSEGSKDSAQGGTANGNSAAPAGKDQPGTKVNKEWKNLPGNADAPIFLSAVGTKLYATCEDRDALHLVSELYRLLQTPAGEGDYEIIKLKYARAADAAKTLDEAFNGNKPDNNNNNFRRWWWGMDSRQKDKEPRIRVVPDSAANSLLVQANPLDMILVHNLVKDTIDVNNIDSNAIIRIWPPIGPLQNADADDVADTVKELYQEHLNQTLSLVKGGALRNNFFEFSGPNFNTDANGNPRPVDLTVRADIQTNTIIVACPKPMYEDIKKLVGQLDDAAKNSKKVWMAVPIKGIDPALIQQALDAIQGKRHNGGSGGQLGKPGGGGKSTGSGSQSRGPDFFPSGVKDDRQLAKSDDARGGPDFFVHAVKDDRQLARNDDPQGGPDFFAHGVKDDPQSSSIFYDPQRDSGVKTAGATSQTSSPGAKKPHKPISNFHLVKLEEEQQPPSQPTTIPPGPRGPITAEALPELGVIVLSANSQQDLERARALIEFIQKIGAVAEIQIQITELKHADATSVAATLTQLYKTVSITPSGNVRAPTAPAVPTPPAPQPGGPAGRPGPTSQAPTPMVPGQAPGAPAVPTPTQQFGSVVLIPLPRVNGIMWAAPRARVQDVADQIQRLDVPSTPEGQMVPFPLRKVPANRVENMLRLFYATRYPNETDAAHQLRFTSDQASNTVFVQAAPSDLNEIRQLISLVDNTASSAVNDLRIIPLRFAVATELATLMTQAIAAGTVAAGPTAGQPGQPTGPIPGQPSGPIPGQPTGPIPGQPSGPTGGPTSTPRPGAATKGLSLKFYPAPGPGVHGPVVTGILEDIFITPDSRTNSLIISAPEKTMELLVALVRDLDIVPSYHADIKVFQLRRADAATMAAMLESLFYGTPGTANLPPRPMQPVPSGVGGTTAGRPATPFSPTTPTTPTPGGPGAYPPPLLTLGGVTPAGAPLIPIRITVDDRTNSLIVVGTTNDLEVIRTIIVRLEDTEVVTRKNEVYALRNSSANDVAAALANFLTTSLSVVAQTGQLTAFPEIDRDVVVIPEPISNKLLISATPEHFPEVMRLIAELDSQPAQVIIQVLIAEVDLSNEEEFGVEIGLQSPVLFKRSVGSISTINTTIPAGATGFNFNNPLLPLPNSFAADPGIVGFQSLGNFGTGRVSPTQGVGGFVFSAANDTFNLLIRALKVQGRIDILSRPQIQTLDGQQAMLNIGSLTPLPQGSSFSLGTTVANIQYYPIGVNLTVVPRVNPDNTIIMRVVPEVSSQGPTIMLGSPSGTGSVPYPTINQQHIETTVLAADGETIAIGGLITKSDMKNENKIPWVGDLPYIGALFRFRTQSRMKKELLVIMTPHVVRSRFEADRILAEEARRMDWVLGDVAKVHGTTGLEPIFPPPSGPRGAGQSGSVPNPSVWPGISCPPSPLSEAPLAAPSTQEPLPSPRTVPGPQSQPPPGVKR